MRSTLKAFLRESTSKALIHFRRKWMVFHSQISDSAISHWKEKLIVSTAPIVEGLPPSSSTKPASCPTQTNYDLLSSYLTRRFSLERDSELRRMKWNLVFCPTMAIWLASDRNNNETIHTIVEAIIGRSWNIWSNMWLQNDSSKYVLVCAESVSTVARGDQYKLVIDAMGRKMWYAKRSVTLCDHCVSADIDGWLSPATKLFT